MFAVDGGHSNAGKPVEAGGHELNGQGIPPSEEKQQQEHGYIKLMIVIIR